MGFAHTLILAGLYDFSNFNVRLAYMPEQLPFRDDLGQYFTPTPVINLMVGILQPTVNDFIGDSAWARPAC